MRITARSSKVAHAAAAVVVAGFAMRITARSSKVAAGSIGDDDRGLASGAILHGDYGSDIRTIGM
jgi:hypothetical protein